MKFALVQYSPEWENPENNIVKIYKLVENSLSDEDVLLFPEMTLTGFTNNSKKFAEEEDGIGTKFFMNLADKFKIHVFAGIIERDNKAIYNSIVHFDRKGIITARYRKIHPFSFSNEHKYFNPGKEHVITKVESVKFGLSICYDLRFPEIYRLYGKDRTEVIINIANWPVPRIEHWKLLLRARAIENLCYVIGVNRVGVDPTQKYNGCSAVFGPSGEEIILAGDEEEIIKTEIDLEKVTEVRNNFSFLDDIKLL